MNAEEEMGFLALGEKLDESKYAFFTYLIETPVEPKSACAALCREQSTALWNRVDVKEDFRPRHGAKVVELKVLGESEKPNIELFVKGKKYFRVLAKIAHPTINFGPKLPNLITAAAGEGAFFCHGINTIKLIDVHLPPEFTKKFEGPKFGVEGIRKILEIEKRPLFLGVVKPNVGLNPEQFAQIAYEALLGGLDIAKDDEMISDVEYSPTKERIEKVMEKLYKVEDKTGEKKMYLVNITDEVYRLEELHDLVAEHEGHAAVMLNVFTVGLSAVRMLARKTKVPIFSHFDFISTFTRIPFYGVSSELITKIERLAGCDAIIMPGFGERMMTTEKEVIANANACLYEMPHIKKCLPIPGGSDWAGTLRGIYEKLGTVDFAMVPGRGVFGHPLGAEAGARSLRQAWEAIENGIPEGEYAKNHLELQKAYEAFGKK